MMSFLAATDIMLFRRKHGKRDTKLCLLQGMDASETILI